MKNSLLICLLCIASVAFVNAQVRTPAASVGAKLEQAVGLTTITVDYSRPSAKGRKIYGELVPFGQLWRTGANQGTKINFADDVKINGKDIKAGKYALFTMPGASEWQVILHKNATLNVPGGDGYKQEDEAIRFAVTPSTLSSHKESFTVEFDNIKDGSADMYISWEKTKVTFSIDVNTDTKVMANINSVMAGPSANDYMASANYYMSSGKDMNKAVEWASKAVSMGANQFWNLRAYSLVLAKAGKVKEAVAAAKESLTKAQEAKNGDYIKMNEASIAEWMKKM